MYSNYMEVNSKYLYTSFKQISNIYYLPQNGIPQGEVIVSGSEVIQNGSEKYNPGFRQ